jgi:hypothetical protein
MPINPKGEVLTGDKARAKITQDILTKSDLTPQEVEFVMHKLKDANYKGHEFETFYAVWVKLTQKLQLLKEGKQ